MKISVLKSYWIRRLLASDPGRKRLNQAGKATISLISSVFTTMLIMNLLGHEPLLPSIISGMAGMMGIMVVMDDTKKKKQMTTIWLSFSGVLGITFGSLLAWNALFVSTLMIVIIFCSFYFSRYGSRYFSLGMIGFFTVYISSFLKLPPEQFPWFYLGIGIGISYAFIYNFIIFKGSVQLLRRSMNSFHRQANLTFQLLIEVIEDPETVTSRKRKLEYNVGKLRKYASHVAADLNEQDIREIWPGLKPSRLRLYVFDTAMFVMTFADSLQKLKKNHAFDMDELRSLLLRVIFALQQADVLNSEHENRNLEEAEEVVRSLRQMIDDLFENQFTQQDEWLYLLRRIEAIATHVTKGAKNVQFYIKDTSSVVEQEEEKEKVEDQEEEEKGLKPTTKKAFQSLIAGTIAIIVGYLISPIQPYWVVLTTFIVQLGTETVGRTYLKGLERSIGTVMGAIIGFVLAKLVSGHSTIEVVLLFSVVFLAFYLLPVSYTVMSMFITMLIAFMYDLILGGVSYQLLGARVIDTIAGAAIALGVSAVIYPTKTIDKLAEVFIDYLEDLNAYVTEYMKSFQKSSSVKGLAKLAFEMDDKIQTMEDEVKPVLQGPGVRKYSGLPRLITFFTVIHYYAKQLVASSYKIDSVYPGEVSQTFQKIEEKFSHNVQLLITWIETKELKGSFYDLKKEREEIERRAPGHIENHGDLVHHLYYIWKINQSILLIGERLGLDDNK